MNRTIPNSSERGQVLRSSAILLPVISGMSFEASPGEVLTTLSINPSDRDIRRSISVGFSTSLQSSRQPANILFLFNSGKNYTLMIVPGSSPVFDKYFHLLKNIIRKHVFRIIKMLRRILQRCTPGSSSTRLLNSLSVFFLIGVCFFSFIKKPSRISAGG